MPKLCLEESKVRPHAGKLQVQEISDEEEFPMESETSAQQINASIQSLSTSLHQLSKEGRLHQSRGARCQKAQDRRAQGQGRRSYGRIGTLAFSLGRLVMTPLYGSLWPCASIAPAILALKWSHPILRDPTFLCECGAREQAQRLSLEIELAGLHCSRPLRGFSPCRSSPTRSGLRVGFAPVVELRIGHEDSNKFRGFSMPSAWFACGATPWSGCSSFLALQQEHRTYVLDLARRGKLSLGPTFLECKITDNHGRPSHYDLPPAH